MYRQVSTNCFYHIWHAYAHGCVQLALIRATDRSVVRCVLSACPAANPAAPASSSMSLELTDSIYGRVQILRVLYVILFEIEEIGTMVQLRQKHRSPALK